MTNDYGNLELHKVLLSAMKDVDKICREHGLRYYLHAGTLLGAINHKGFIPWDDDVDIAMLRADYETFIEIVQRDYSDKYFLHNYMTDPDYPNNRSVMRVLGTKVTHFHESKSKHTEIAVDIVPLDNAPDSKLQRKFQKTAIWIYDAAVKIKQGDIIPHHPVTKCIALFAKMDRVYLGKCIDKWVMKYNHKKTKEVGLLSYTWKSPYNGKSGYENDLMLREWFENPIYVDFEDTCLMTISDPKANLDYRYGPHWMDPYPEEKRITKHDIKAYEISKEVRERVGI